MSTDEAVIEHAVRWVDGTIDTGMYTGDNASWANTHAYALRQVGVHERATGITIPFTIVKRTVRHSETDWEEVTS